MCGGGFVLNSKLNCYLLFVVSFCAAFVYSSTRRSCRTLDETCVSYFDCARSVVVTTVVVIPACRESFFVVSAFVVVVVCSVVSCDGQKDSAGRGGY